MTASLSQLLSLSLSPVPRWNWQPGENRLSGGNAAAALLLGYENASAMEDATLAEDTALAGQLNQIAKRHVRQASPGIERLRIIRGYRALAVTALCTPLADGQFTFEAIDTGTYRAPSLGARVKALGTLIDQADHTLVQPDGAALSGASDEALAALVRNAHHDGRSEAQDSDWHIVRIEELDPPIYLAQKKTTADAVSEIASHSEAESADSRTTPSDVETSLAELLPEGPDPLADSRYRLLIDLDGVISSADEPLCSLLGYTQEDINGVRLLDVTEGRDDALERALASGMAFRDIPTVWTGPAGQWGFILSGAPVYDEDLQLAGYRALATGGIEIAEEKEETPEERARREKEEREFIEAARAILEIDDEDLSYAIDSHLDAPASDLNLTDAEAPEDDHDAAANEDGGSTADDAAPQLLPHEAEAFRAIGDALGEDTAEDERPQNIQTDFIADEALHVGSDYRDVTPANDDAEQPAQSGDLISDDQEDTVAASEGSEPTPPEQEESGEILPVDTIDPVSSPAPSFAGQPLDEALLDELNEGILVFREDTMLYANKPLLSMFGYADIEALNEAGGISALIADTDDTEPGGLEGVSSAGEHFALSAKLRRVGWKNGSAMAYFLQPVEELDTVPVPLFPPDDTLRSSEDQIADEIKELRAILDTATEGVVVLDSEARIERLNQSAEALFGYDTAAVTGRPFEMLIARESRETTADYIDGLRRNGVASILNDGREVTGKVAQGGTLPVFLTMGRLGEQDNSKFCAVIRDMTQWKKAESDLIEARRHAESVSEHKSDFLAKISHEIRTPLNAIIGFSEVMAEERFGPIGNERYRGYVRDIRTSGEHVLSLINDLLDLSKIEAGHAELEFDSVMLNDAVGEAVALMQAQANKERIIIRTNLTEGLPPVVADQRSLHQILLNLLSNAVKFTKPGGQIIVSTIHASSGEVALRVRDTGVGMSKTDIRTALEPFRQAGKALRPGERGTGLGLPLTKALVEANRASFDIESKPDHGTLIEITFPQNRVLAE